LDSDDDLAYQLLQDKRQSAKKVQYCTSPSNSNKPATRSNKGNICKQHYDPITALNMWEELQDKPRTKHASHEDAKPFGC
jgi:hypothetical protein